MKWLHKLFSLTGSSLGGADACIKYGCKEYCGYSPSEFMRFIESSGDKPEKYSELKSHEHKYSNNQSNEIEIVMDSVNNPPKVKLNGKEIEGIICLEYRYETSGTESNGYHNFTVQHCDKETNTIRTVSANKIWEG